MKKLNIFYTFLFFGFIFFTFRNWFLTPQIIGGDWPYFFEETFKNYSFYFSSWNPFDGNGFGGMSPFYSLGIFHGFTVFLSQTFYISWAFIYKFSWFGLFLGLSIFSSIYLLRLVLPKITFWQQIFAAMIFTTNTYVLMMVSGGQMGVALAYSLAPLVLARFIKIIHNSSFPSILSSGPKDIIHDSVIAGLVLALQVMFDPRIVYLTMLAVSIYCVSCIRYYVSKRNILNTLYSIFYTLVIPIGITILLHAVWILPFLFLRSSSIPEGITSVEGFRFFSFAD
ncbi:MAG: hypothetical protein Q7K54_06650, partial [Candidatus Parcubacteria bacterium]|nr:hypothetical protein [Candidatus Parcubacteria bacterium]